MEIREEHGGIPFALLHLAGPYDEETAVPTLAEQIRRIYEGARLIRRSVHRPVLRAPRVHDRRLRPHRAPARRVALIGEPDAIGHGELEETLARLIHEAEDWTALSVPKPLAAAGSWVEQKTEAVVPADFDPGEEPSIKPFMVQMADAHFGLDIGRARSLLDRQPTHSLWKTLTAMVTAVGVSVMTAPLVLWAKSPAAYTNGSLVSALIFALAACTRPAPGMRRLLVTDRGNRCRQPFRLGQYESDLSVPCQRKYQRRQDPGRSLQRHRLAGAGDGGSDPDLAGQDRVFLQQYSARQGRVYRDGNRPRTARWLAQVA